MGTPPVSACTSTTTTRRMSPFTARRTARPCKDCLNTLEGVADLQREDSQNSPRAARKEEQACLFRDTTICDCHLRACLDDLTFFCQNLPRYLTTHLPTYLL